MPWTELSVDCDPGAAEQVGAALESLGALSVTLAGAQAAAHVLEPAPGAMPLWNRLRVTALFEDAGDDALKMLALAQAAVAPLTSAAIAIHRLDDQPWERIWLAHFRPLSFNDRLWIVPAGLEIPNEAADKPRLMLDPGLAFGTGTHPTTALCLDWLTRQSCAGRTVLDYGCGSGILGLAALALGAERALCVDHDPQALAATRENAALNGLEDRVLTLRPDELGPRCADLLLANLLSGILIALDRELAAHVAPRGRAVFSGILAHEAEKVSRHFEPLLGVSRITLRDDWARLDWDQS